MAVALKSYARFVTVAAAVCALAACDRTPAGMIPNRVVCDSCRIEITPLLTIGDTSGPSILTGRPYGIVSNGKGKYWVGVLDAFPLLFDSAAGTLHEFAREGDGPGEFRHPSISAHLPGDSLLVRSAAQWQVVSPEMISVRSITDTVQLMQITVVRWPDRIIATTSPHRRGAGRTTETRTVIATFDLSGPFVTPTDTVFAGPWLNGGDPAVWASSLRSGEAQPRQSDDIWIADVNTYRIVKYSLTGEPLDSVLRRPDWFPGGEALRIGGPDQPTTPQITAHWIDDHGRMWVLLAQPRTDTKDAWEDVKQDASGGISEVRVSAMPPEYQLNRTVIEVIDLAEKRVIARHTFDGYITEVLSDSRVASFVETESGVPVLTIHRLRLQ